MEIILIRIIKSFEASFEIQSKNPESTANTKNYLFTLRFFFKGVFLSCDSNTT